MRSPIGSRLVRLGRRNRNLLFRGGSVFPGLTTLMALATVAGQAVGPTLSGSVIGTSALVVAQAIRLDVDHPLGENPVVGGANDAATTRNDEGTEFTVGAELAAGQTIAICLMLQNDSFNSASAVLELDVPGNVDIELEEFSGAIAEECPTVEGQWFGQLGDSTFIDEVQLARYTWLMTVDAEAGTPNALFNGVRLLVEGHDSIKPGFYTISGRITQIDG